MQQYAVNKYLHTVASGWIFINRLNMFRALLCPSSGVSDYKVDNYIGRFLLGLHLTSNLQQTKNETTKLVINIIVASC